MGERIVLLTGASSGIGREIAHLLVKKGDYPIVVARNKEALEKLVKELGKGTAFSCDVTQEHEVNFLIERVILQWGRVDVLINSAGFGQFGGLLEVPMSQFEKMMDTNYLGAVRMTRALLPHMERQGAGIIINIASTAGLSGVPNLAAYVASKFALIGFSESIHLEYAPKIQIGVLCPGPVNTPFFAGESPARLFPPLIVRHMIDAKQAAYHAVRLIDHPRIKVIPFPLAIAMRLRHLFPGFYRWFIKRLYDKHKSKMQSLPGTTSSLPHSTQEGHDSSS